MHDIMRIHDHHHTNTTKQRISLIDVDRFASHDLNVPRSQTLKCYNRKTALKL